MYKRLFGNKKAIFFDLDGTIIDTASIWQIAFNNVVKTIGLPPINFAVASYGMPLPKLVKDTIKTSGRKIDISAEDIIGKINEEYLKLFREHKDEVVLREGFSELIYELKVEKPLKLALVTNSFRKVVMEVLDLIELNSEIFDCIVTGDEVKKAKPSPEIYLKAAKELKVHPEDVLVFEDSIVGATSAVKAGMEVVVIWDQLMKADYYPGKIKTFVPDFLGFPGNLDTTIYEALKRDEELVKEFEKDTEETSA